MRFRTLHLLKKSILYVWTGVNVFLFIYSVSVFISNTEMPFRLSIVWSVAFYVITMGFFLWKFQTRKRGNILIETCFHENTPYCCLFISWIVSLSSLIIITACTFILVLIPDKFASLSMYGLSILSIVYTYGLAFMPSASRAYMEVINPTILYKEDK